MFTRSSWLCLLFLSPFVPRAQLVIDSTFTPVQLVEQFLGGEGVQIANVTFNGVPGDQLHEQIGRFDGSASNIGLQQGLIMCTGDIAGAIGPNNLASFSLGGGNFGSFDPDLEALSTVLTNDAGRLEFDLVSDQAYIGFRFVFASEEYPEYVCGSVNDAFGFFLSGPGISGPFTNQAVNIALVPYSQSPISINSVNPGVPGNNGAEINCSSVDPAWQMNTSYYQSNGNGFEGPETEDPTVVQYDGFTTVIWATYEVVPGEVYHLKLVIADGGDTAFDSAVFLESGSFISAQFPLGVATATNPGIQARTLDGQVLLDLPGSVPRGTPVWLLDATGRQVLRSSVRSHSMQLEVGGLSTGVYSLHLPGTTLAPVRFLLN